MSAPTAKPASSGDALERIKGEFKSVLLGVDSTLELPI